MSVCRYGAGLTTMSWTHRQNTYVIEPSHTLVNPNWTTFHRLISPSWWIWSKYARHYTQADKMVALLFPEWNWGWVWTDPDLSYCHLSIPSSGCPSVVRSLTFPNCADWPKGGATAYVCMTCIMRLRWLQFKKMTWVRLLFTRGTLQFFSLFSSAII